MVQLTETGCCPRFDPSAWDGVEVEWHDKPFIADRVRSFLHVPLNFGAVMKRNMEVLQAADACDPDHMVLSEERSPWCTEVHLAVTKEVPGKPVERLSGRFFAKVYEGPYSKARHWCKDMQTTLAERGTPPEKLYSWYTTCPRCAKAYGKNYVVLFAQLEPVGAQRGR